MGLTILIADDDPHIRDVIEFAIAKAGHRTILARDGAEAWRAFAEASPDLIVLDVGMPEMDGLEVCRRVRRTSQVPILFLSARDDEVDRILGLEIGGDDYITKPFSPRELVARIGVIMRRAAPARCDGNTAEPNRLVRGDLLLDRDGHEARFAGVPIALTSTEFGILTALMGRPGQVLTRDRLTQHVYGGNIHVSDRTVDSHIRNLRRKFALAGCETVVETLHGIGFRLGRCSKADQRP